MKELFSSIKKSVYDPVYYQEILTRPAKYSVKYFFGLALFLSLILTVTLSVSLLPLLRDFLAEVRPTLTALYPDELILRVDQGVLTSNVPEPFFIDPPERLRPFMDKEKYRHLVVIDTASPVTPDRFALYETPLWLSARHVVAADTNGQMKINTFPADQSFLLDKGKFVGLIDRVEPYFKWLPPLTVFGLFVGMFIVQSVNLVYLILGALLILLLARLVLKQKWSYGKSYRVGLHALTLPILLDLPLTILGFSLENIPFLATGIMLVIIYMNFKEAAPAVPEQPPLPLDAPPSPEAEKNA